MKLCLRDKRSDELSLVNLQQVIISNSSILAVMNLSGKLRCSKLSVTYADVQ